MSETTYTLSDDEWSEALRAAMDAAFKARFEDGNEDGAAQVGVDVGKAKAHEIAQRRLGIRPW